MASPDTDELATVPLPAGPENPPGRGVEPGAGSGGEAAGWGRADSGREAAGRAEGAEPGLEAAGRGRAKRADLGPETEPLERAEPAIEQAESGPETVPQERVEPERISPEAAEEPPPPAKDGGRWWRGFTSSVAAGLVILAVGVLAVGGICLYTGAPGPGATLLIGHPIAAVLGVVAQRVADRRNGLPAAGAGVAVMLFAISALTLFWLT
ncbi:hypothetical protein ABJI51_31970 [Amycolatopsis sp. NEAU-NG30]|uniref:DUF4190 domain-containing protein n=1 Tax=Amycolatopsis melonis TaxID=3156488 RepID=A0ABV0LN39_9PSEU